MADARHRSRADYFRAYNAERGRRASKAETSGERLVIGIDGEGYTLKNGSHRYVYMAAASPHGTVSELRNPKGLSAEQVFAWLLTLPRKALLVGFSLGYDRTKWVESWPDERVWRLMRPEERKAEDGQPMPVEHNGYRVNLVSTRMTVKRVEDGEHRAVWDVWKFFQSSFVSAMTKWDVGAESERAFIAKQKDRRGAFRGIGKREERYCQDECRLLAMLTEKLLLAHEEAGLKLRSYYGPGSTAASLLAEMGAERQKAHVPKGMALAVACAYFGGRFECSRVGPQVPTELITLPDGRRVPGFFAYDIASAYPYATTQLPCLDARHGKWVRRKNGRLKDRHSIATLVRFEVRPSKRANPAWGPLPHRTPSGDILFPLESAGGWAWVGEFKAARKLHPGVTALETWTWKPTCTCGPPFAERVRELFELRKEWGKSAKGMVLKLALNSLYGKSAQRQGSGRFRCMVRAGLITSLTRAKLLHAVSLAKDPWDILELATDSVLSRTPLPGLGAVQKSPALGDWEEKPWEGGAFLMRPGVRFPILPDAEAASTAARGVGMKTIHKNRARIVRLWEKAPMESVTLATPSFFHGAKLSVRAGWGEVTDDGRDPKWTRAPEYGRWTEETRTLSYKPTPKRAAVNPDYSLEPHRLPRSKGCESVPYGVAGRSVIGDELEAMRELEEEQPEVGGLALV